MNRTSGNQDTRQRGGCQKIRETLNPVFKIKGKIAVLNLAIDHTEETTQLLKRKLNKGSLIINLLPEFKVTQI